jgi:hypothetical protein
MHLIAKYRKTAWTVCLLFSASVHAQLVVQNGAALSASGHALICLQNVDLINNGTINQQAGNARFVFTGTANNTISGNNNPTFDVVEIAKTGTAKILLLQKINVVTSIDFTTGLLDLNGYDVDLGTTGMLNGEQENSRVVGATGGQLLFSTVLNAPSSANPANLGAIISSSQNLGNTLIKRGHQSQTNLSGSGSSILRYYDITPAGNTALDATLRLQYFNSELNGLDQNALGIWRKPTGFDWTGLGFDDRSISPNFVEKNSLPSLDRFTLSTINSPLPVRFVFFNTQCNGTNVLLSWRTAQEQNNKNFVVERSVDGIAWYNIATIRAMGNTAIESSYSFTDNAPAGNDYYRVASYDDANAKPQLTNILYASCTTGQTFSVWPNPVNDLLYLNAGLNENSAATIKLFDSKGTLVKQQAEALLRGNNLVTMNMQNLAAGIYYVTLLYNKGQLPLRQVIKR